MWSFFSRDPIKDFNYDIGEKVPGLEEKSIWTIYQGKKRGTGDPVSVFGFDVKGASESQAQIARGAFKRIKTLRHPNFLTFLDGIETDKVIYFATEAVTPLETHLNNEDGDAKNELAISWGLHQIVKGLSFLVNDCNLIHNNVCMASVFVDQAGEWKLGGVEYMYPAQGADSIPPVKIFPILEKYDPPEKAEMKRGIRGDKWSSDMWGLGCLIWEVFNGTLPRTASLKSLGKIPKSMVSNYCELVGANPKSRPNPAKFREACLHKGGFLDNSFVKSMLFLEEFQIKDQNEKTQFFTSLTPNLDSFPPQFCRHKILPQLMNAFEYGNAGSSVLAPLFKLGKLLDAEEYQRKIVPCVVKLFSSPDRATRVKLLQQVESFVEHLQPSTVNDQIFPNIVSGFMDTNPMVRESTIKAMLHMAHKLNYRNLNEELMKHFARLQSKDDQGGIRTNTTVCLGKIGHYLDPRMRQKILCSAFLRATKDPFPPARQAGVLGLAATQNLYSLKEVSSRLLPSLCCMTMDPEKIVRDQVFKVIKGFVTKLEKVSENPDLEEEMDRETMTGGSAAAAASAGWAGWAVTGMTSLTTKIYKKATAKPKTPTMSGGSGISLVKSPTTPDKESQPIGNQNVSEAVEEEEEEEEEEGEGQETEQGWDTEDWGNIEEIKDTSASSKPKSSSQPSPAAATDGWDDDDEDWGSLEDNAGGTTTSTRVSSGPTSKASKSGGGMSEWGGDWGQDDFTSNEETGMMSASDYNWGGEPTGDDFFSSCMDSKKTNKQSQNSARRKTPPKETHRASPPAPTAAPPTAKSSSKSVDRGWDDGEAGWDDGGGWAEDSFGSGGGGMSEAERKKQEREEKRLQRQRELQEKREARKGGGAMKLGAKKIGMS